MPSVVTDASGQTVKVRYSYLADGTKLSVRDAQNDGLSYRGSFVYKVDGAAGSTVVTERLESIAHDEGRFLALSASAGATTTQFIDTWHIKDYLGSVRTVLDITRDTSKVSDPTIAILEQNDYLPFGIRIDLDSLAYDQSNRYRFNGKEEQITGNIGLTDYGARFYDNVLPRWTTPDPLAEKYYGISPYAFCNNNPVNFVDPDGESWGKATKIVKKIYKTAKAGEKISVKGILKSEWVDIADNARTIFDSDASLFEKGIAAFDLATGFGDEAKWLAKTVGVSDAIVDGAKASNKKSKLQKTAEIGQEAHRQIEKELKISVPGTKTEVQMKVGNQNIRKDAVMPDGTVVIIKPDTPSGHKAAARRDKMMKNNGYKTQIIFYDPTDSRWLPDSPTYIGPKY